MIAALVLAALLGPAGVHEAAGLADLFAYAGPQAADEFLAEQQADPSAASGYWGEALARGTDLNTGLTAERFASSRDAIAKASAVRGAMSERDGSLIDAVAARYSGSYADRDRDEERYRGALERYVASYADDDTVAMLLVEDLLERHGMTWNENGSPVGSTSEEILTLVQRTLARSPHHLFANHLCIHAYDNAPDRSFAIACAQRLDAMTFIVPQEHLAHMPAHVWIELGDGKAAVASSERAWELSPARYAEHDAYVALSAALMCGDAEATARWSERLGAASGHTPDITPPAYARRAIEAEHRGDVARALSILEDQARTQDATTELVPFYPADERIGALLLRTGSAAKARDAFAAILAHHPRRPRALFGIAQSLLALGRPADAAAYQRDYTRYWAGGALTIADF